VQLERLQVEFDGPVARVWMNRPDARNAFDGLMTTELRKTLFDLRTVDAVRVIVIGGRGPAFCAGADLQWMKATVAFSREENLSEAQALADLFFTVYESPKPVIARVHGAALGGGAGLVAACDIPVAALGTQFGHQAVQGTAYGMSPYFRISYATDLESLREGCKRIQEFCADLR
jgi:methylglutaconyl-CoA hydratase